jgi:hypothetical protein
MDCKKPWKVGAVKPVPCGKCLPCLINKRRVWTHRIILEAMKHEKNSFVTLTYSPEYLPEGGTLVPEHVTKFLKRLRKAYGQSRIRYYCVGEYGDNTWRPHYHLALFGAGVDAGNLIQSKWTYGHTHIGELNYKTAQYVAGYVTKKMTGKDDPRLNGRHPEYAVMSRRPGIGMAAVKDINATLNTKHGKKVIDSFSDVPTILKHGKKSWPLGRYMVEKLRDAQGWEKSQLLGRQFPQEIQEAKDSKMLSLSLSQENDPLVKEAKEKQRALNREIRHEIFNKRRI